MSNHNLMIEIGLYDQNPQVLNDDGEPFTLLN